MSYQIIPNIIFILSVLGILLLILRRLPEAAVQAEQAPKKVKAEEVLLAKGLPAQALSKVNVFFKFWISKIWNFALEAKDLRPHSASGYKMKKIFGGKLPTNFKKPEPKPITTHEVRNEQYYLDMIRLQPKNRAHYDALAKFYLDQNSLADAKDIYLYLASHEPHNPEYHARLALCHYKDKEFAKAVAEYQKSLGLDSTQPNRYYNLGLSQEAAGDFEGAIKSFQSAIELENTNSKFYLGLSSAYARLGDNQNSHKARLRAKELE